MCPSNNLLHCYFSHDFTRVKEQAYSSNVPQIHTTEIRISISILASNTCYVSMSVIRKYQAGLDIFSYSLEVKTDD